MRIDGHWLVCRDGLLRPVATAEIRGEDGTWHEISLLIDTGADETFLTSDVLHLLGLEPEPAEGVRAEGVGGLAPLVVLSTTIRLPRPIGPPMSFNGRFNAFTSPGPLELSYLGRDILNIFAVIIDKQGDTVCLIRDRHHYTIQES